MKNEDEGEARAAVGLRQISYYVPEPAVGLEALVGQQVLTPDQLTLYRESRGLRVIHLSEDESASDIAVKVAAKALREGAIDPLAIDAVIYFHSMYNAKIMASDTSRRIREELGLRRAVGWSVWGQACTSINSALRVARDMIRSGSAEQVLVVGADSLKETRRRAIQGITLMGDGGAAAVVSKGWPRNRIVALANFDEGSFFRYQSIMEEDSDRYTMLYFIVTARIAIKTLQQAGLGLEQMELIIPHNINWSSWELVLNMLRCDRRKLYGDNIQRRGHVFGADVLVNLADAIGEGRLREGEYALLLTAGMGACWGSLIIQH